MKSLNPLIRILIVVSPFFLPWWIVFILALAALFYFDSFYEIVALGLICDVLYASSHSLVGLYGFTLISGLILILVRQIKKRLIMY